MRGHEITFHIPTPISLLVSMLEFLFLHVVMILGVLEYNWLSNLNLKSF